ncbi:hypothetical protein [Phormidesmis sp. 146-33]
MEWVLSVQSPTKTQLDSNFIKPAWLLPKVSDQADVERVNSNPNKSLHSSFSSSLVWRSTPLGVDELRRWQVLKTKARNRDDSTSGEPAFNPIPRSTD